MEKEVEILGWIIIKNKITPSELAKKFQLEKSKVKLTVEKLVKKKLVRVKKRLLREELIEFRSDTAAGKKEKSKWMPRAYVKDNKKKFRTNLDTLLYITKVYKRVNAQDIAYLFKTHESIVENWGRTLERENLITIKYRTFGRALFSYKEKRKQKNGK